MSRKLTVKDMKRDEVKDALASTFTHGQDFLKRHGSKLLLGAAAVLLGALAISGIMALMQSRAEALHADLGSAVRDVQRVEAQEDDAPTWPELAERFEGIAGRAGGDTKAIAQHYAGVARLRGGDPQAAVTALQAAAETSGDPWVTAVSLSVLATAQEDAGDESAAEASLERLRELDSPAFPADAAALRLAELYERLGRVDEAKALYESLTDSSEQAKTPSAFAGTAESRLEKLKG